MYGLCLLEIEPFSDGTEKQKHYFLVISFSLEKFSLPLLPDSIWNS